MSDEQNVLEKRIARRPDLAVVKQSAEKPKPRRKTNGKKIDAAHGTQGSNKNGKSKAVQKRTARKGKKKTARKVQRKPRQSKKKQRRKVKSKT